jgi:hypothetical protein
MIALLWAVLLVGFLLGCAWGSRGMTQLKNRCEWAENCVRILDEERRKPPHRVYRSRSKLLTDDESDALWESVMGGPPVEDA